MKNSRRPIITCIILALTLLAAPAYLLHLGANRERLDDRLLAAIRAVDAPRVNSLLDEGADPNSREGGRAEGGPIAAIRRAMRLSSEPSPTVTNSQTALQLALDPDISTPVKEDLESPRVPARETMALALVARGADPNRYHFLDQPPLACAAGLGMTRLVQLLLRRGANVDGEDFVGNTALMECRSGEIAAILVRSGADPNHRSREGFTPLLQECFGYYGTPSLDKVRELLAAGADVNAVYYDADSKLSGQTSLMFAARDAASPVSVAIVSLLLSHGANINMIDSDKHNALYYALHPDDDDVPAATKLRLAHLLSPKAPNARQEY